MEMPARELVGRTIFELRRDANPQLLEQLGRVVLTGVPAHLERYNARLERWLQVTAYRRVAEQLAVIVTDITERRRAELKRESILKTALDGFCEVDASGRFMDVNDVYCRMTGYSREELLSVRVMDVEAEESLDETLRNMNGARFETLNRHKDGHVFPVEVSTS